MGTDLLYHHAKYGGDPGSGSSPDPTPNGSDLNYFQFTLCHAEL